MLYVSESRKETERKSKGNQNRGREWKEERTEKTRKANKEETRKNERKK